MPLTLDSVAQLLKQHTLERHTEAEKLLLPRLSGIADLEAYASLLQMYYGYFHPLEKQIQTILSEQDLPDIRQRRNTRFLVADLSALPVAFSYPAICHQLPVLETKAQAFGALYVAEGSSLGGRVIAKMLLKNSKLSISHRQLNYFNGYGERTGMMWTQFLQVLNEQTEPEQMIQAANETFLQFENWIKASPLQ